jgi:hypothetical protein
MLLTVEQLNEIVPIYREHLIPCWERYHDEGAYNFGSQTGRPAILSSNACRHTSAFVFKQLVAMQLDDLHCRAGLMRLYKPMSEGPAPTELQPGIDRSKHYRASLGVDDDGYDWSYHYWLEHNGLIIDLTKDQFGWDGNHIHSIDQAASIYRIDTNRNARRDFSNVKSNVAKFEGIAQTYQQENDPHFDLVRASFEMTSQRVLDIVEGIKLKMT